MTRTYQVTCLSEAVSPITQMAGSAGNESVLMREQVVTARGVVAVPKLSGNALRHRLVREPGFRWLVNRWGLAGRLTLPQLNFLFHGGNLTEGGGREDTRRIADFQRLFPLGRLLGGSLPDQILSGSLLAWHGLLVCEENRSALAAHLPEGWQLPEAPLRPAESFVGGYQNVRGDAAKTCPELAAPEPNGDSPRPSNLMIFAGQAVSRGGHFLHGFTLQHVGTWELGALLLSLRLWQSSGGTIGGQGARGHGRLRTLVHVSPAAEIVEDERDANEIVNEYVAHCDAVKDEAVAWLNAAFAPRPKKEPKAKAGAKA